MKTWRFKYEERSQESYYGGREAHRNAGGKIFEEWTSNVKKRLDKQGREEVWW